MSNNFIKIKEFYDTGLWNKTRVNNMVIKGVITQEEYMDIVGEEYEE